MTHSLTQSCSLAILFSNPKFKVVRGDDTAIYHPGDTVSGFLKILCHAHTAFEDVSLALEGELPRRKFANKTAEAETGTVRIWEETETTVGYISGIQHRVRLSLSSRSIRQVSEFEFLTEAIVSQTSSAFGVQQWAEARNRGRRHLHDPLQLQASAICSVPGQSG